MGSPEPPLGAGQKEKHKDETEQRPEGRGKDVNGQNPAKQHLVERTRNPNPVQ